MVDLPQNKGENEVAARSGGSVKKAVVAPSIGEQVDPAGISNVDKIWATISYLPFLSIGALVLKQDSGFCKLHASQGFVITLLWFVVMFLAVLGALFMPLQILSGLAGLALLVVMVFGMMKAWSLEAYKIPIVNNLVSMIPVDALFAFDSTNEKRGLSKASEEVSVSNPDLSQDQVSVVAGVKSVADKQKPNEVRDSVDSPVSMNDSSEEPAASASDGGGEV